MHVDDVMKEMDDFCDEYDIPRNKFAVPIESFMEHFQKNRIVVNHWQIGLDKGHSFRQMIETID